MYPGAADGWADVMEKSTVTLVVLIFDRPLIRFIKRVVQVYWYCVGIFRACVARQEPTDKLQIQVANGPDIVCPRETHTEYSLRGLI